MYGEHTSKQIIASKGDELKGRKIILCVTGSVAAIKSPEIARELMRRGAEVYTVMTEMAQKIIHPYMMEWATGNPVITELTGETEHVTLAGDHPDRADLILVAPCTANTIGKAAAAIDDSPVTTMLTTGIGASIPVIIAPAMHGSMYKHPFVSENIRRLRSIGIEVVMPRFEEEKAKIPSTEDIIKTVVRKLTKSKDLKGIKMLVTAGPTREYLDAFRFITNPSSGKMGVAIANEALSRGIETTLIMGPNTVSAPYGAKIVNVETTKEMLDAVMNELETEEYDVAILAAAACDYGVKDPKNVKTQSGMESWHLKLVPLPKIIEHVKKVNPNIYLVGFKAEHDVSDDELVEKAFERLKSANMDLMVANDVARKNVGFGTDTNEVFIINKKREVKHIPVTGKDQISRKLLDIIKKEIKK